MASGTVSAKLAVMFVIFLMTGNTFHRCTAVAVGMAVLAFHASMFASQLKSGQLMIEGPVVPGTGVMACSALFSKAALMEIILLVAGNAGCGSANEEFVCVALSASHSHMRPNQFETGQAMVIMCRVPGLRSMAGGTICAQFSFVGVIGLMTGNACLRRQFQVRNLARA